jgi:hypothetical protein
MTRHCDNWIKSYLRYATPVSEMEERGHRWIGLATVAAVLGRKVWIDQVTFKWFPNMYVVIISEAGMSKTTTLDIGTELLQKLKRTKPEEPCGVVFGPQKATWQSIVERFNKVAKHSFAVNGEDIIESPLHFSVSEWSTLISANDPEFQDQLINWWDGKPGDRATLYRGEEAPINPIINMVGCTTLHTFNDMFSQRSIEGGFLSRCVVVRCSKARSIAYPAQEALKHPWRTSFGEGMLADLRHMNTLTGAYTLAPEAVEWGEQWYHDFKANKVDLLPDFMVSWANRKQTYLHKVAMINRICKDDSRIITLDDLKEALEWIDDIEASAQEVLGRVGMKEMAVYAHKILGIVQRIGKGVLAEDIVRNRAFNYVQQPYDWDQLMRGMIEAGMILRYKGNLLTPAKAIDLELDVAKVKEDSLQLLRRVV